MSYKLIEDLKAIIRTKANLPADAPIGSFSVQFLNNKLEIEFMATQKITQDFGETVSARANAKTEKTAPKEKKLGSLSYTMNQEFSDTQAHFIIMKSLLQGLRRQNFLTQPEIDMMAQIGGVKYKDMSIETRQEILAMFKGVQARKAQNPSHVGRRPKEQMEYASKPGILAAAMAGTPSENQEGLDE